MPAYLKYGDIKGESVAPGHEGSKGWIEINSVQVGVHRAISTPTGASSKREASAPHLSEISISKLQDSTSVPLFQESVIGDGKKAEIHLVRTGPKQLKAYMEITLENAVISSYVVSGGADDRPHESITINYTKIEYKYTPTDDAGKQGSSKAYQYDVTKATGK